MSKCFDPLNLVLPVTIKCRIILRGIWAIRPKLDWDDPLPLDVINIWHKLVDSLSSLHEIPFPRFSISSDETYGLHIFCDASVSCYGFVAYACDESNHSNLLFSKSKMAAVGKSSSIPTLELMSVVLAFKCIPTLCSRLIVMYV